MQLVEEMVVGWLEMICPLRTVMAIAGHQGEEMADCGVVNTSISLKTHNNQPNNKPPRTTIALTPQELHSEGFLQL